MRRPYKARQSMPAADSGLTTLPSFAGYRARSPRSTIADRPAVLVKLQRRGLVRELWLDRASGLPLRTLISQPGGLVTDTHFTSFALAAPPQAIATLTAAESGRATVSAPLSVAELSRQVGFPVHEPAWLPAGFRLAETRQCSCPCGCRGGTAQLMYSDGVGHVSVFYTGEECQRCYASESACAACAQHNAAVQLTDSAVQVVGYADERVLIVAIGDARASELARIAASVPAAPALGPDSH